MRPGVRVHVPERASCLTRGASERPRTLERSRGHGERRSGVRNAVRRIARLRRLFCGANPPPGARRETRIYVAFRVALLLVTRALLDTSAVIVGAESVQLLAGQTAAISVVTLGELRAGVRVASDPLTQAQRRPRLAAVRRTFLPLAVDESVAEEYGEILAQARLQGRVTKATDLLIIATAAATGRILHTLDQAQARLARELGVAVQS